jgi:phosphatidylglycerophosphate synthase
VPAVLICNESSEAIANFRIAGLNLLDRLAVTAHRAGCGPIIVVSSNDVPRLERASALDVPVQFVRETPAFQCSVLLASVSVLVTAPDIRSLLQSGGRLTDADSNLLPVGLVEQMPKGGTPNGDWVRAALAPLAPIAPRNVARRVVDVAAAGEAQRALWASLTSSSDGLVDRVFNRPCGRPVSKLLVHTAVSPNAVSLASIFVGVLAGAFFAAGDYATSLLAAAVFQLSAILDCIDGDLARVLFKESAFGKWLDLAGDQIVHVAVFGGIALGVLQTTPESRAVWLGLSAIAGALLSFAVVVRGLRRSQNDRTGRLQRLLDAATNRDFSVLVFCLAVLGQLELFLWVTAIGTHVFWITALTLQLAVRPTEARAQ